MAFFATAPGPRSSTLRSALSRYSAGDIAREGPPLSSLSARSK